MSPSRKRKSSAKTRAARPANRRNRQRSTSLPPVVTVIGIVAGLFLLVLFFTSGILDGPNGPIEGVQTFTNLDRSHTNETVAYDQIPPVGGAHNSAWQNCGIYTEPVPSENAVHSLEHGAIWITYQPDLPAEQVQTLRTLTRRSLYRLLSPYPDLPSPVVVSAWGYQLQLEDADDPRLIDFMSKYERNPEGPEPAGLCTGGVGTPG